MCGKAMVPMFANKGEFVVYVRRGDAGAMSKAMREVLRWIVQHQLVNGAGTKSGPHHQDCQT